jgi:DNA-binding HxlR family transcriptional regulator
VNQLVRRTVYDTSPVTIEYALTPYGKSLKRVIIELEHWGRKHRERIMGKAQ